MVQREELSFHRKLGKECYGKDLGDKDSPILLTMKKWKNEKTKKKENFNSEHEIVGLRTMKSLKEKKCNLRERERVITNKRRNREKKIGGGRERER